MKKRISLLILLITFSTSILGQITNKVTYSETKVNLKDKTPFDVDKISPKDNPVNNKTIMGDFEFELQMGYANSSINSKIETVYLMPTLENAFVSSTIVREIVKFEGKFEHLVPKEIVKCMS